MRLCLLWGYLWVAALSQYLSIVDLRNPVPSGYNFSSNFAGASIDFSTIYTAAINSSIFQGYLSNSRAFGSNYAMMPISLKVQWPKGYKYNCSAYTAMNIPATCLFNYSSINAKTSAFVKTATPYTMNQFNMGFDMENANFSNPSFASYFTSSGMAFLTATNGGSYYNPF